MFKSNSKAIIALALIAGGLSATCGILAVKSIFTSKSAINFLIGLENFSNRMNPSPISLEGKVVNEEGTLVQGRRFFYSQPYVLTVETTEGVYKINVFGRPMDNFPFYERNYTSVAELAKSINLGDNIRFRIHPRAYSRDTIENIPSELIQVIKK